MFVVADLRSRNVSLQWQEAVAIVQELAATVGAAGPAASVPDLEHVAIAPDGELVVLPGSAPPDHPVKRLAGALQTLVAGTAAPPELRLLVSEDAGNTPTHASVEEFSRALAIFERPGRRNDIAAVLARDPSAEAHWGMESELEGLRARARLVAENRTRQGRLRRKHAPRRRRAVPLAASVLVLLGVGMLLTAVWLRGESADSAIVPRLRTLVSRTDDRLVRLVQTGVNAMVFPGDARRLAEARQAASLVPDAAPRAGTERRPAEASPRARAPAPPGEPERNGALPPIPLSALGHPHDDSAARAGPADSGLAPPAEESVVYTTDDAEVVPAVMLRPRLPSAGAPQLGAGAPGVLDIVVSETGAVEHVRLISSTNRFQERMLVAAAKAWKFRPALKDGQPVKYRLKVRITL